MITNPYHRAVIRHLRERYDVHPKVHHGGKHLSLAFDYDGRPRRLTLSVSPSDGNTLRVKLRDIRRELGPPMEKTMIGAPFNQIPLHTITAHNSRPTPSEASARGSVACYASNKCLSFSFPTEIKDCLDVTKGYGVTRHGDGWEIRPGGNCTVRPNMTKTRWKITASAASSGLSPAGWFDATTADYLAVDGVLLVSLVGPPRVVAVEPKPAPVVIDHKTPMSVDTKFDAFGWHPEKTSSNHEYDREGMRAILSGIALVEKSTDWRLTKVNGSWEFRVPPVRLED